MTLKQSTVLLGDSIFDNLSYVPEGQDVASHLRRLVSDDAEVVLLAVDGATTHEIAHQIPKIPAHASHLILSAGGNDALSRAEILALSATSVTEVLILMARIQQEFQAAYRGLVGSLAELKLPLFISTIYYPVLLEDEFQSALAPALSLFNDVILSLAFEQHLPVIDMRLACSQPEHFANVIEPSAAGGERIAEAVANAIAGSDPVSQVFAS